MDTLQDMIRAIRNLRAEAGLPPQKSVDSVVVRTDSRDTVELVKENEDMISLLAKVKRVSVVPTGSDASGKSLSSVLGSGIVYLPVGDLLDIDSEIRRLEQEKEQMESNLSKSEKKLANPNFVERAPLDVVEKERGRIEEFQRRIHRIAENIASLSEK
jgi:valyl-tRNA synthetase